MLLGLAFAFLGLLNHIKIIWKYYRGIRNTGYLDPKLAEFIKIKEINDHTVFLTDKSAKAIVQITPLHFNMLSPQEQRAIIAAYREFLNSLDFQVQIVMRTIDLSLSEYLAALQKNVEKTRKKHLITQFESFKNFIQDYLGKKHVKNRLFYAVIPAPGQNTTPNLLMMPAKNDSKIQLAQLDVRVKVCQDKLKRCNLVTRRLETNELVTLTSTFFEGFIEAQNEYLADPVTLAKGSETNEKTPQKWLTAIGQPFNQNLG